MQAAHTPVEKKGSLLSVFRYSGRAITLVWETNRGLTIALGALTLVAGILPAAVAFLSQLIVDGVVALNQQNSQEIRSVIIFVIIEGILVASIAAAQSGLNICQSLLRALLGQKVNVMILEKALQLDLSHFEDSEFYDKLTRARREASSRPLSLVNRTFGLIQNSIAISSFSILLWQFSGWAVAVLVLGGLPAFLAEVRFSEQAFRLFYWRSPESRKRMYLETVMAREDYAKEVQIFGLGSLLLERYREIFRKLFTEDRSLILRRGAWTFGLGLVGTCALYGSYTWVVITTILGGITLGQMTMYMLAFKQGQSAVSASLSAMNGMYEDNLYLSNLYTYLEQNIHPKGGQLSMGENPQAGIEFDQVSFTYPGSQHAALSNVSIKLKPGQSLAIVGANGCGKTTLVKLLTGLYPPSSGQIKYQGHALEQWDVNALRQHFSVIFQDFARYQMLLGENIGAGDANQFNSEPGWERAGELGMVTDFLHQLPKRYQTQLGKWFQNGQELSGGQWQKIALARAFMREDASILILDEPTAAIDAEAEAQIFEHFQNQAKDKISILISHRFSSVRLADTIIVMDQGKIIERGNHEQLMALNGRYAQLFRLQIKAYGFHD